MNHNGIHHITIMDIILWSLYNGLISHNIMDIMMIFPMNWGVMTSTRRMVRQFARHGPCGSRNAPWDYDLRKMWRSDQCWIDCDRKTMENYGKLWKLWKTTESYGYLQMDISTANGVSVVQILKATGNCGSRDGKPTTRQGCHISGEWFFKPPNYGPKCVFKFDEWGVTSMSTDFFSLAFRYTCVRTSIRT